MIRVSCAMGEFTIKDGEFVEGGADLKALFDLYSDEPLMVWEGPLDFALAYRMCQNLQGGYKILEERHTDGDEQLVY